MTCRDEKTCAGFVVADGGMMILDMPKPPKSYRQDMCEMRKAKRGEMAFYAGTWCKLADSASCLPVAIPPSLTGMAWLEAQKPCRFVFEDVTYAIVVNGEGDRIVYPVNEPYDYARCQHRTGNWVAFADCFPNGHERLSDDTCRILKELA